jgi:4-amino-4-deoxy-L-arabinose transferase and related glycosyltransferases of PMT family
MGNTAGTKSSYWQTRQGQGIILAGILIVSAVLFLANLGNQNLWQDEAQTALISKTILTEGVPRGYDGKNYFSQEGGAEYGKNYIWRWHTWLPFYVLAGFYKVFGISTFVSRLPFVLFGLGTVVLLYYYARAVWPGTRIPAIAAALLTISVPFLLLCRECRYYSMAIFFTLLSLYAYVLLLEGRKYASVLLFAATTLLFHSQHIYLAALFPAVFLHAIIFRRDLLKILTVVTALTILVNVPWLIWLAGVHYPAKTMSIFMLASFFSIDVLYYVFPVWLPAAVLLACIARRVRTGRFFAVSRQVWERLSLPFFFVVFNILAISVAAPYPFFRYLAPAIPLLILLAAVIINAWWETHLLVAAAAVVMLVATSQMKDYLYEITHDYKGPEKGIAKYLNEHGSPDDIVAITYGDMGLKFYTKMRVVGGLTGEDLEPAKNARWVILRQYFIADRDEAVTQYLKNNIRLENFRRIVIDYPDMAYENRESPGNHTFRIDTDENKVVIYERMN